MNVKDTKPPPNNPPLTPSDKAQFILSRTESPSHQDDTQYENASIEVLLDDYELQHDLEFFKDVLIQAARTKPTGCISRTLARMVINLAEERPRHTLPNLDLAALVAVAETVAQEEAIECLRLSDRQSRIAQQPRATDHARLVSDWKTLYADYKSTGQENPRGLANKTIASRYNISVRQVQRLRKRH